MRSKKSVELSKEGVLSDKEAKGEGKTPENLWEKKKESKRRKETEKGGNQKGGPTGGMN